MLVKQIIVICITIPFIEYYNYIAVSRAMGSLKVRTRNSIRILYIVLSLGILSGLFIFPGMATTSWPSNFIKLIVNMMIGMFLGKFLIAILMLIGDVFLVLKWVVLFLVSLAKQKDYDISIKGSEKKNLITRSQFISRGALICGAALTAGLGYGMTNKYRYRLRYVPLPIVGLPDLLKGFRIVQISDIHAGSFDNKNAVLNGVEMVLRERPDLILFTGDIVNYRSDELGPYMDIFKRLDAPLGVYSILGNHDYGDYLSWTSEQEKQSDFNQLLSNQKAMGWNVLLNNHKILKWKGQDFALIGVENWSIKARFPKYGNLKKAMLPLENSDLPLKILMSHDPSHWDAEVRPGYPDINLTLSGHTHGMQLGIDIPGLKWSPSQYIYKQWAGLYREQDQYLYVNRGFGFIGYDGRLGILPEITVFELI